MTEFPTLAGFMKFLKLVRATTQRLPLRAPASSLPLPGHADHGCSLAVMWAQ
jgi:hypothetical protein